jgi:hypothetical protein
MLLVSPLFRESLLLPAVADVLASFPSACLTCHKTALFRIVYT